MVGGGVYNQYLGIYYGILVVSISEAASQRWAMNYPAPQGGVAVSGCVAVLAACEKVSVSASWLAREFLVPSYRMTAFQLPVLTP